MTFKCLVGAVSYLDKIVKWQPKSKGDAPPFPLLNETLDRAYVSTKVHINFRAQFSGSF